MPARHSAWPPGHFGSKQLTLPLGLVPEPAVWVTDDSSPACEHCRRPWTPFRRRHHCRLCGHLFCNRCAPKLHLPAECGYIRYGYTRHARARTGAHGALDRPERACTACHCSLQQAQAGARCCESPLPPSTDRPGRVPSDWGGRIAGPMRAKASESQPVPANSEPLLHGAPAAPEPMDPAARTPRAAAAGECRPLMGDNELPFANVFPSLCANIVMAYMSTAIHQSLPPRCTPPYLPTVYMGHNHIGHNYMGRKYVTSDRPGPTVAWSVVSVA